jgi:nitrate/TMAO reductase-like tetraheme cytochrome c subunit
LDTPAAPPSETLPPPVPPTTSLLANPISIIGFVLIVVGGIVVAAMTSVDLRQGYVNPYNAIVGYVLAPGLFLIGLALVPLGLVIRRRRMIARSKATGAPIPPTFPIFNPNRVDHRRAAVLFGVATLAVIGVIATAGVKGYEYGDTAAFCGLACHSIMQPQYETYQASSHARVDCVRCHIGPGTGWFVRSKLSGANQVVAATFNTYPRPIPAPIESLRPSRDTCEECHWPERVYGDRLRIKTTYQTDEANTPKETQMVFRVGGGLSHSSGIHWHIANEVWYLPQDSERQDISWVAVKGKDGAWAEYVDPTVGARPSQADVDARGRRMDCIDCHNRSAHDVRPYSDEVDRAMTEGRLDASLPSLKQKAVDLGPRKLDQPYMENADEVLARIATLADFYKKEKPAVYQAKQQSVDNAVSVLSDIYQRSVFPGMRTDWNTYADNIGHEGSRGCFRCHGVLTAAGGPKAGQTISPGCTTCHYEPQAAVAVR